MTSNVLCKYYLSGCCKFGNDCLFSHDKRVEASNVCTYYLAGCCAYGDRCRYDHVKPDWSTRGHVLQAAHAPPPPCPRPDLYVDPWVELVPPGAGDVPAWGMSAPGHHPMHHDVMAGTYWYNEEAYQEVSPASMYDPQGYEVGEEYAGDCEAGSSGAGGMSDPADVPLCKQFAAYGSCALEDDCELIHGLECEICHKWYLHPYNEEASTAHRRRCETRKASLAARMRSADLECGICLERVAQRQPPSERRFGLLACEHIFCLSCIRNWRTSTQVDTDTAARTCPVCRTPTHFVTPSSTWPASTEEKESLVAAYKRKLGTIDCRNFDFGDGNCPFGTSCFYRHVYRDGRKQEPTLRKYGTADGEVKVLQPIRLAHFLETPQARRLLGRQRSGASPAVG